MHRRLPVFLLVSAVLAGACASTSGTPGGSGNVIALAELEEVQALTVYDAIQRLRPAFLRRGRVNVGDDTMAFPIVYLDRMRLGGIEELHRIRTAEVLRIEYMSGADATTRFGTGHKGGALLLTSRARAGGQ